MVASLDLFQAFYTGQENPFSSCGSQNISSMPSFSLRAYISNLDSLYEGYNMLVFLHYFMIISPNKHVNDIKFLWTTIHAEFTATTLPLFSCELIFQFYFTWPFITYWNLFHITGRVSLNHNSALSPTSTSGQSPYDCTCKLVRAWN